jgi:hypothetical protein
MRNYLFILICIFCSCDDSTENNEKIEFNYLDAKEIYRSNVSSTVTIVTDIGTGSGFFIDESTIVTNYHVVDGAKSISYYSNNAYNQIEISEYLNFDTIQDLVLLSSPIVNSQWTELSTEQIDVGEKLYAIGSPFGLEKTISEGILSSKKTIDGVGRLQITTPISHGSSGCPIFNVKGKAIGLAVSGIDEGDNIGFAIPISNVVNLLEFSSGKKSIQHLPVSSTSKQKIEEKSRNEMRAEVVNWINRKYGSGNKVPVRTKSTQWARWTIINEETGRFTVTSKESWSIFGELESTLLTGNLKDLDPKSLTLKEFIDEKGDKFILVFFECFYSDCVHQLSPGVDAYLDEVLIAVIEDVDEIGIESRTIKAFTDAIILYDGKVGYY